MGKLRDEAAAKVTEDVQEHKLTDAEMGYLRMLNLSLQYHVYGQKIVSGFLYYICTTRLGYKDGTNLQFELDFDKQDNMLIVKILPDDALEAQAAAGTPTPSTEV